MPDTNENEKKREAPGEYRGDMFDLRESLRLFVTAEKPSIRKLLKSGPPQLVRGIENLEPNLRNVHFTAGWDKRILQDSSISPFLIGEMNGDPDNGESHLFVAVDRFLDDFMDKLSFLILNIVNNNIARDSDMPIGMDEFLEAGIGYDEVLACFETPFGQIQNIRLNETNILHLFKKYFSFHLNVQKFLLEVLNSDPRNLERIYYGSKVRVFSQVMSITANVGVIPEFYSAVVNNHTFLSTSLENWGVGFGNSEVLFNIIYVLILCASFPYAILNNPYYGLWADTVFSLRKFIRDRGRLASIVLDSVIDEAKKTCTSDKESLTGMFFSPDLIILLKNEILNGRKTENVFENR